MVIFILSSICDQSIVRGKLNAWEGLNPLRNDRAPAWAASNNHFETLKWLILNKCPHDVDVCCNAAFNGNLEMLQWARENGCEWNERVCTNAAMGGHLHILIHLRRHNCPWNTNTLIFAEMNGHDHIAKWAEANGLNRMGCHSHS